MRGLILLLLIPVCFGLVIESAGQSGTNPVMYGELVAYESDGIHIYDVFRHEDVNLGNGTNPFLFGLVVVFDSPDESVDSVVKFANVRTKNISIVGVGRHPSIFADDIFYSIRESELSVDVNIDGDLSDDVIQIYDIDSKKVSNLSAIGDFPVANQNFVVFLTGEEQTGVDLNADGDLSDKILRVYNRETRSVENVPVIAEKVLLSRDNFAVFLSNGVLKLLDVRSLKVSDLNLKADDFWFLDDVVLFVRDGSVFGYNLDSKNLADLKVFADDVSFFDDVAVFVSNENKVGDLNGDNDQDDIILRIGVQEDVDEDGVFDFVDNCAVSNENQSDVDNDGVGDLCEKGVKIDESGKVVPIENINGSVNESAEQVSKKSNWFWFLLIIVILPILPFVIRFGIRYYKKRQKSFGF